MQLAYSAYRKDRIWLRPCLHLQAESDRNRCVTTNPVILASQTEPVTFLYFILKITTDLQLVLNLTHTTRHLKQAYNHNFHF